MTNSFDEAIFITAVLMFAAMISGGYYILKIYQNDSFWEFAYRVMFHVLIIYLLTESAYLAGKLSL